MQYVYHDFSKQLIDIGPFVVVQISGGCFSKEIALQPLKGHIKNYKIEVDARLLAKHVK